ncbi:uncharacterized protein LOC116416574 [Nasonia vitripennis]|uniref:DNA-directed DNA polymerase n=1 Tax=Nasonia vitripennis TaxID=7425 RepID=A0A7M7T824_NASVI|nr:uncharacterized protein LOC116416574 [Nasonia vitripennis]
MEEFQERDSGWTLHSILNLTVNVNKLNPMRGSSYIDLPSLIKSKHACINVKNNDNQCFKWAVLSALHPVPDHVDRVSKYQEFADELNFEGIDFPVPPKHIVKFEKQNDVSVNLYILKKRGEKFEVSPCHVTVSKKIKHVNLLFVQDYYVDEDEDNDDDDEDDDIELLPKFHYVLIKDLSKLFKNFGHRERVPFIVYADFECLLRPIDDDERAYQQHEPFSVGYYLRCSFDDSRSEYKCYRQIDEGLQSSAELVVVLQQSSVVRQEPASFDCRIERDIQEPQTYECSHRFGEREEFERARVCHVCRKLFSAKDTKVKDHCHLTRRYRGPAHNKCNINYNDSRTIPVIFHNLSGYDSHLFIKEIATCFKGRVSLIPQTKERYISFSKFVEGTEFNIRFIDSYRFMASSLEKLASYLEKLSIAEEEFQLDYTTDQTELLKRKGVFPYDYISCFDKLKETELPTKEEFYNKLNDSHISDDEYEHAKTDVILLADVFENFRDNCLEAYGLDPAHYYTTPGLTWDAMLKYTNIELELPTDVDILLFVERGIRGGVSQCSNRYAKANNRYMGETYNEPDESKYLVYYDINNLYGWAMRECLPYGGFKWVNVAVETSDFFQVPDDHPVGYILEVDFEYPEALHDAHKDLPLCPERMPAPGTRQEKLMTTLHDKERYVIHYRSLKQALKHGLRLKKIHRILKFDQRAWL